MKPVMPTYGIPDITKDFLKSLHNHNINVMLKWQFIDEKLLLS